MEANGSTSTKKKWAIYTIKERGGGERAIFVRVGVAFVNRDDSFNIHLDATPLDGKLHMREWKEDAATSPARTESGTPEERTAEVRRPKTNGKAAQAAELSS